MQQLMHIWTLVKKRYPELVENIEEIQKSMYVDDIVAAVLTRECVASMKETAVKVFRYAEFELNERNSKVAELEN